MLLYNVTKMLKDWLLGRIKLINIPDFDKQYQDLLTYETVTFTENNQTYVFTREEITKMREHACTSCQALRLELETLRARIDEKKVKPDIRLVVKNFIARNFEPSSKRLMPRRYLFDMLNEYIAQFGTVMLSKRDPLWRYTVRDIIGDSTVQFRYFKLVKRIGPIS